MGYIGAKNLAQISKNTKFIKITKLIYKVWCTVLITQKTINYKL